MKKNEEAKMHRLAEIMETLGIDAKELSTLCGLHYKSIEKHMRGENINRDSLMEYKKVFQLPMEFILGEKNDLTGRFDIEERLLSNPDIFKARFYAYNVEQIDKNKSYYLIFERRQGEYVEQGAHTEWKSFTEDGEYEIRIPRLLRIVNKDKYENILIIILLSLKKE